MSEHLTAAIHELTLAIREGIGKHETEKVLHRIAERIETMSSKLQDWAAQEQADLSAISKTLNDVVTGIAALDQKITDLQNSPGTLSAADQAALDAIQAQSSALKAQAAAISVAPPAPAPAP